MNPDLVTLEADRQMRIRAAVPAVVFIAILTVIALWLSIPAGPIGMVLVLLLIAAGVVWFFKRTTSVALAVGDDAVVVRNTLKTTRVPFDAVEGIALTPDGELTVLVDGKRPVTVEAADGRDEAELEAAAEATMEAVDQRASAHESAAVPPAETDA
jgi:hypothetical protein